VSIAQLLNRPCTITHRQDGDERDEYGNALDGEMTTTTVCELQQRQRSETTDEIAASTWALYLPAGTAIDTGDAVEIEGVSYEVDGEPWAVRSPITKGVSHIEATVRRTAGVEGS
jgi:hypothetical protein